jgi:carbamoyl-phosphate synthase large subunit
VRKGLDKLGNYFSRLYGCDADATCIGRYGVDCFWHCPPLDQIPIEDLIAYCHAHEIEAIIPTRNGDLEYFSAHEIIVKQNNIKVMVSSKKTIEKSIDKKAFASFLQAGSFPVIPTALHIEEIEASAYVVKERHGAGSQKIGINLSKEKAIEFSHHLSDPIFQPYVEGQEWSLDLYRTQKGKVMGCIARQRNLVVLGESQVTTTASYPSLERLGQDVANYLGIYGHAVIQVLEDARGEFHIIECNARFGGASTASLAVGLDSFYWFLLESAGQIIESYPFIRSKKEICQVRHMEDWILPWS